MALLHCSTGTRPGSGNGEDVLLAAIPPGCPVGIATCSVGSSREGAACNAISRARQACCCRGGAGLSSSYLEAAPSWRHLSRQGGKSQTCMTVKCTPTNVETVGGTTFNDVLEELVQRLLAQVDGLHPKQKYMVGIAGGPGSGKSTMASALCNRLNRLRTPSNGVEFAAVVPMDGFHYYKAQLDSMKDPMKAYLHRGAHWTFDAAGFVAALRRIRETGAASLPSFDHGRGDPVEDDIKVQSGTRLVIVEGNYLLLEIEPWSQVRELLDERWFASCPLGIANERVYRRHVRTGKSSAEARWRVESNDGPNGRLVQGTAKHASLLIDTSMPMRQSRK